MTDKKSSISRKEALKQLGGLALTLPLSAHFPSWAVNKQPSSVVDNDKKYGALDGFPPLFPFEISHDSPDNVTNMKILLEAPAGKNGFIRVKNGRFVNDKGPVKLNGTSNTGPANFPTQEQADLTAKRLAKFGINCVRLHYMDDYYGNFRQKEEQGIIEYDPETQRNFDPKQVDKLDYLIFALKSHGIYVDINLHVARWWDDRDGFPHQNETPVFDKGLDNFEPRMIALQKEYARKLLTHINPYTGLAYTDDSCVAMIEINNENSIFWAYFNDSIDRLANIYAQEFRKQWNQWLKNKYKNTDNLHKTWGDVESKAVDDKVQILLGGGSSLEEGTISTVKNGSKVQPQAKEDFFRFIIDTEKAYFSEMYQFLRNDLKVKSLICGTQLGYCSPFVLSELDYLDNHTYWHHPGPVNPQWKMVDEPMVNSMGPIKWLAAQKVKDKPYNVSEFNAPFPNQYGAEAQPILRAYGQFQGWDGVFVYTYNERTSYEPTFNDYFFAIIDRTDVLAHLPACAAFFLRGDVKEGLTTIEGALPFDKYVDHLTRENHVVGNIELAGLDLDETMLHKTVVNLSGTPSSSSINSNKGGSKKLFVSDTGELTWNIEREGLGYFTVDTPNSKLFTGFPDGRKINMGSLTLSIGKTRLGWATVSLVSKYATGFGESGRTANILLAATGICENKNMELKRFKENIIWLKHWGERPVYAEGIPAVLTLPSDPSITKCFALDTLGNRMREIPVNKLGSHGSEISLSPSYKTIWYEIEIKG